MKLAPSIPISMPMSNSVAAVFDFSRSAGPATVSFMYFIGESFDAVVMLNSVFMSALFMAVVFANADSMMSLLGFGSGEMAIVLSIASFTALGGVYMG